MLMEEATPEWIAKREQELRTAPENISKARTLLESAAQTSDKTALALAMQTDKYFSEALDLQRLKRRDIIMPSIVMTPDMELSSQRPDIGAPHVYPKPVEEIESEEIESDVQTHNNRGSRRTSNACI